MTTLSNPKISGSGGSKAEAREGGRVWGDLGRARLRYEEKKKLVVSSGLEVGKQMILSLKSLGSRGRGQRQGGPEHNGKDETLIKW